MMLVKNYSSKKKSKFTLLPDMIAQSVASINFTLLKDRGVKACLIDLDGTIVSAGKYEIDKNTIKTIKQSSLDFYIATNRPKKRSLRNLSELIGASGSIHPIGIFGKPSRKYYQQAINALGLSANQTAMIGDRYIQDILGANRAGMHSVLVHKFGEHKNFADKILSDFEWRITKYVSKNYKKV
jgi:uncharacterized protein